MPHRILICDICLGNVLAVTSIIRELQQAEFFDGLSAGIQEQNRSAHGLKFAEMLLERGKTATVILDDALVCSDPERVERMLTYLLRQSNAPRFILTRREDLLNRLRGAR